MSHDILTAPVTISDATDLAGVDGRITVHVKATLDELISASTHSTWDHVDLLTERAIPGAIPVDVTIDVVALDPSAPNGLLLAVTTSIGESNDIQALSEAS